MSTGGAAEYLCLPETLIFMIATILEYRDTVFLYGREYNFPNAIDSNLHDSNAPCAVCRAWESTVIMYQVRNDCPCGWKTQYTGYLMNGFYRTSFTCADKDTEAIPGSSVNTDGALLYHVEAACTGIPCPPYDKEKELTCAICTL